MAFNKIPIKIYYDSNGDLYTYGNLNVLPALHRLSNYAYELYVICPFVNTNNTMYFNYKRSDNTQNTTPIPMAYVGREDVKVLTNNTETTESWYKYMCNIEDSVLSIASAGYANTLQIIPNIQYYTITGYNSLTNTTTTTTNELNFAAVTIGCIYSVSNTSVYVEDTPLETIIAYINTALGYKVDKVKGIQIIPNADTSTLPTYSASNKYTAYIFRSNVGTYHKGDIVVTDDSGYVTINSPYELQEDIEDLLDEKVDKLTSDDFEDDGTKVYTATLSGTTVTQGSIGVIDDISEFGNFDTSMPKYDSAGQLQANAPTGNYDVTNKNYVDSALALKLDKANGVIYASSTSESVVESASVGTPIVITSTGTYNAGTVLLKTTTGFAQIGYAKDFIDNTVSGLEDDIEANTTSITSLTNNKLNKIFGLSVANAIADSDILVINSGGVAYQLTFAKIRDAIGGSGTNHYKGDFVSLAALQAAYPTASPGDYAFVNTGSDMIMYVWDSDYQTTGGWRETTTGQYVLSTTFATYQSNITSGNIVVGKASDYDTTSGGIKTKFDNVQTQINGKQNTLTASDGIDSDLLEQDIIAVDDTIATVSYVDGLAANREYVLTNASGSGITLSRNATTSKTAISVDTSTIATKSSVDSVTSLAGTLSSDLSAVESDVSALETTTSGLLTSVTNLQSNKQDTVGYQSSSGYLTSITLGSSGSPSTLAIMQPDVTKSYVDTQLATKSSVSVSATGSATDTVSYITVDGTQKKIGGANYTAGTGIYISGTTISNTMSYEEIVSYTITNTLTNVSKTSGATTIETQGSATLVFSAASGYDLPSTITVSGASYTWTQSTGTLVLSDPTANVSVTISGVSSGYSVTFTSTGQNYYVYDGTSTSGTLLGTISSTTGSQTLSVTSGNVYCTSAVEGEGKGGIYPSSCSYTGGVSVQEYPSGEDIILLVTGDGTATLKFKYTG